MTDFLTVAWELRWHIVALPTLLMLAYCTTKVVDR